MSLAWDPGANGQAASYNVYYGTASHDYTTQISTGTNLAATVSSLVGGSTYYFAVTAVDVLGNESDFSNEINYLVPGPTQPLTISSIANQSTPANTAMPAIPFTVTDPNAGAAGLTLTGSSSATGIVPNANIVFGGAGASHTVTITPTTRTGTAQITITANDGLTNASTTFSVTVVQGNTPPTISTILSQTTTMNKPTAAIAFTVGDANTGASSVTVSGSSSDQNVVPNANIVFAGSAASRTVTITPAANITGSSTITVTASDGITNTSTSFTLTIQSASAPVISAIVNQTTLMNQATPAIAFTVSDQNTSPANVTLSASSSVPNIVPNANVVFGGSGANRTVKITPGSNMTGSSVITITANDGVTNASTSFTLTVQQGNTPPSISAIGNQTVPVGHATAAIPFTINDAESPASSLTLSANSGNTFIVPKANIVFGGSGANRTVTVTPSASRTGSTLITVSVSDGLATTSTNFTLTVQQSTNNTAPTISVIANQNGYEGQPTGAIPFTIGDAQTPAASLTLSAASDNTTLVPVSNITFGGSGANRNVTITPAAGQTGIANITVTVSDGTLTTSTSFALTIVQATALPAASMSKGSYSGLFYESDAVRLQSAGSFKLTVTKGKYSGSVQMASGAYPFTGTFGTLCVATNVVVARKGSTPLTLSFSLEPGSSTNQFAGDLSDGTWTAGMFGSAAAFSTKTNPAPYAGSYTLAIPGQSAPSLGDGFGSLKVDGNGNVKFSGVLADGTKITQSATLSRDGTWGMFVPLYSGQGFVMAWISFQSSATDDLHGPINWLKQPNPLQHVYPGGVVLDGNVVGSLFNPASVLALNVQVSKLQIGGGAPGQITSMKISTSTGTFKGNLLSSTGGQSLSFQGALLLKPNAGYGFIMETNQTAPLVLTP